MGKISGMVRISLFWVVGKPPACKGAAPQRRYGVFREEELSGANGAEKQ
jgi:hypothetical protein